MITIGIDPHKRTHTAVAVSGVGQLLSEITIGADEAGQEELFAWAHGLEGAEEIRFALEDCRHGNRQLNAAFYRIALTQARVHPGARAYLAKKRAEGKSGAEALRCLKRLLVRVVWTTLRASSEQRVALSQSRFLGLCLTSRLT